MMTVNSVSGTSSFQSQTQAQIDPCNMISHISSAVSHDRSILITVCGEVTMSGMTAQRTLTK